MKVTAIKCPRCGDTIYSRSRHDYRCCTCKATNIDGGLDYVKVGFITEIDPPKTLKIEVSATKEELYKDWNFSVEKFGLIKGEKE